MKNVIVVCMAMFFSVGFVDFASAQTCCGAGKSIKAKETSVAKCSGAVQCEMKKGDKIVKDSSPTILCGKCGEIKGAKKCCFKDVAKCEKCGLDKGAPGCCKMDGSGNNMIQCPKTGKLMACPLKSDKCDVATLKAACAAGKISCGMKKNAAPEVPGK
jgi:hypothetical protein